MTCDHDVVDTLGPSQELDVSMNEEYQQDLVKPDNLTPLIMSVGFDMA